MNTEEVHALRQVIDMYANDEHHNWLETGRPRGHIAEAFSTLEKYRQARSPELDNESLSRARRGDGAEDPPVEEAAEEPSEDSREGFVIAGCGGPDIEWRWAKETIGLAALELNEAYAQLVVTRDGCEIPSGKLYQVKKRLEEAMEHLGVADPNREIPF